MNMLLNANWISTEKDYGDVSPVFRKKFETAKIVKSASLCITSLGVYEAKINNVRVGEFILAPGWTSYNKRLQFQNYDITDLLKKENEITVSAGNGWCLSTLGWSNNKHLWSDKVAIIAAIVVEYTDNTTENIYSDESWETAQGPVRFSEIYDGETFDARIVPNDWDSAKIIDHSKEIIIAQEGEIVKEFEEISPVSYIETPKGEKVIDFGQNITGYVRFKIKGNAGDVAQLSHAEVLDKDGNFYTTNLRSAKQKIEYICDGNEATYKPNFTFQGFRFIRIDKWPGEIDINDFRAIVVHSNIERTGNFECSSPMVNQLYKNVIWGQKGNFLDVPTDCPQRDERLGWTGDAQAFVRTASYNFNVEKFFTKWLRDLRAEQNEDGSVPHVIPDPLRDGGRGSAAWADAAVICPWQIYLTYGNKELLAEQFESMKSWVGFITSKSENDLWRCGYHFGDWLNLEPLEQTQQEPYTFLIATAFYAYSTSLLIKAGKVLSKNMSEYENLHTRIVSAFQKEYIKDGKLTFNTQTAHVLTLYFDLTPDKQEIAKSLAKLIVDNGNKLATGFVGTPYLLHVLTDNGYAELAYSLMLQEEYPSWLFSVTMGATTIWEHWNGIKPDGTMQDPGMNSFNHYAYGACADWMYGVMAGINTDENNPSFKHIIFKPVTDSRIDYVNASIDTKFGVVSSAWKRHGDKIAYTFHVPQNCTATIIIDGSTNEVKSGTHQF